MDWAISSQSTWKQAAGSTTTMNRLQRGKLERQSAIDLDEVRDLAQSLSGRKIAAHFGVHPKTMARWLREWGVVANGIKLRDVESVAEMYRSGKSTLQIARETGATASRIATVLRGHGVQMRPRCQNLGKKMPESMKVKLSAFRRDNFLGENNPNWRGGKGRQDKARYSYRHKEWSKAVRERDGHACQHCGTTQGRLHAHHVQHWHKHAESRFDVSNGLTLCQPCHQKVHSFKFPWLHVENGTSAEHAPA